MEWRDEWNTGVPLLDAQHRTLFDYVNELRRAARQGRLLLTLHTVSQLGDFARFHFGAEERLMRVHDLAGVDRHRAERRDFTERLFALRLEGLRREHAAELSAFLTDWLLAHLEAAAAEHWPAAATESAAPACSSSGTRPTRTGTALTDFEDCCIFPFSPARAST